ncbi:hypothetical protein MesoLj113a_72760 [Mesorhizobium sp. 113-1-2]|nr:hypothetical protein MesoLj113a_72760 [Mesorhizobium sp. 113-1-2]
MGQILHGSATTTYAIRAAIQRSKAPLKELATQHGLNQKTVAKWRKRTFVHDAPMGPKTVRSTVLTADADSDVKPAAIPIKDRPPFRFEAGHHSNQKPASFRH